LESGEGGASIGKESSKGEASKDIVQMVEHLQSSFNSLESNEVEKENPKVVNIPKKPIKASKQTKRAKEALGLGGSSSPNGLGSPDNERGVGGEIAT
jgi:hypothetical protein